MSQIATINSWNLTTPTLQLVETSKLKGFSDQFYYQCDDGQVFYAPAEGDDIKHTKNSTFARCELRETLPDGSNAGWRIDSADVHILRTVGKGMRIDSLPASGKAIIGQWHGKSTHPPFKFQITLQKGSKTRGDIYVQLRRTYNGPEDKIIVLRNYDLGTWLRYEARLTREGKLTIFINGNQVIGGLLLEKGYAYNMDELKDGKPDKTSYFYDLLYAKAGMYSQEKLPGKGAGQSTFNLGLPEQYHGPVPGTVKPVSAIDKIKGELDAVDKAITADLGAGPLTSAVKKAYAVQLQAITDQLDDLDSAERTPLYPVIKQLKARL
jgi:hypothetical protein